MWWIGLVIGMVLGSLMTFLLAGLALAAREDRWFEAQHRKRPPDKTA